jgi:4-hydroxy-tetrahydrodipicolinate synthase
MSPNWSGVFAATLCAFHEDYTLDEEGLREYFGWLRSTAELQGLVVNGHTGEITSLRNRERARVTRLAAETVGDSLKVVSGVCAEGSHDAIDQALAAREAGADAILLMPPHHWLRFGRSADTARGFVADVAEGAGVPIIIHQYPAWTKASYSLEDLMACMRIGQVIAIKLGTRDMARQRYDYLALKKTNSEVSILTCHDEYLLASVLEGADGALVGFAGYAPDLICDLVSRALDGDLASAREIRERVDRIARAIYQFGEPSADAHQRMKMAAYLTGRISSPVVRPPLRPLDQTVIRALKTELEVAGEEIVREV